MKATMVIPSYWSRESYEEKDIDDAIYDHPTPLDKDGTLLRTLQSIQVLKSKDFQLVIIAIPTSDNIGQKVSEKIKHIVHSVSPDMETLVFGPAQLRNIHELLASNGRSEFIGLLSLKGYSNIRNLCLFIPHLLDSDIAVLIDDDEVFEDANFISKAYDYIGAKHNGKNVNAVAGYYLQKDGGYRIRKATKPWMKHWGQYDRMNKAFDMIIGNEPRLKETPFVFGGNMVIHRNLFSKVPFDPAITRGEDIDYLINAKMFGFIFFLDNWLSIKHLPPPKAHPAWLQLRQDIYRFIYERAKIENQRAIEGMTKVFSEDFDPYPGSFLKGNLGKKIETTCQLLSREYLSKGDLQGSQEALRNIALAQSQIKEMKDPFDSLCRLQKRWQKLMEYTGNNPTFTDILNQKPADFPQQLC